MEYLLTSDQSIDGFWSIKIGIERRYFKERHKLYDASRWIERWGERLHSIKNEKREMGTIEQSLLSE